MDKGEVEGDFAFLKDKEGVLAILLFGSRVKGRVHGRSDVDVCVVAPGEDAWDLWLEIDRKVRPKGKDYDVHIFEDLGLRLKHSVIRNHEVVWCRDVRRLEEYFYLYEKLWRDQAKARGVA